MRSKGEYLFLEKIVKIRINALKTGMIAG